MATRPAAKTECSATLPPSVPFRMGAHLRTQRERAAYIEAAFADGDAMVLTIALREVAE